MTKISTPGTRRTDEELAAYHEEQAKLYKERVAVRKDKSLQRMKRLGRELGWLGDLVGEKHQELAVASQELVDLLEEYVTRLALDTDGGPELPFDAQDDGAFAAASGERK